MMFFRSAITHTLRRAQQQSSTNVATQLHKSSNMVSTSTKIASRSLVTSAQKRALNKDQIAGKDTSKAATAGASTPASATPASATPASATTATATPASSGGGSSGGSGGGGIIVPLVALGAAGAGGAYYMDMIPMGGKDKEAKEEEKAPVEEKEVVAAAVESTPVVVEEKKEETVVTKVEDVVEVKESAAPAAATGRVTNISVPSPIGRKSEVATPTEHTPNGNRVSVAKFSQVYGSSDVETPKESVKVEKATSSLPTVVEAEKELTSVTSSKIDDALKQAHVTMRATLDESFLKDLDTLSDSELRIRIVQLASEMGERTKWEAVRLREFLSMKEKEVADRFVELMQKQRLEFEDLLARRLREQEYQITKQSNDALDAKDRTIESVINAAADAQQAEHEAALKSTEERLEMELNAKYEAEFGQKLAEAKAEYLNDLETKVAAIQKLSDRLQTNEQNLEISRNFESGSQIAHRVSAAALALAEKMETSKGAMEEYLALKAAATENGVIASALEKIPSSVKAGIPTLSELQASFDHSHKIGRQAAYVPKGRSGVEGQFAGMLFANLTVEPSPDSLPPPASDSGEIPDGKMSDYILTKAKRHVQLGELQEAVSELDKLKGQVAFTVNDWKVTAMNRIAVDQALKVIKLECALMNKNMGG